MFEIGNSLRDARLRQGLELSQLEHDTKIRARYLKALEEERFDLLPGEVYIKGFLRTYAERLGLDGQLYVDEYTSRYSLAEEPTAAASPRRRAPQTRRLESHAVLIALAGIVAITLLVIAAWQFGSSGDDSESPTISTPPSSTATAEQPAAAGETGPPATGNAESARLLVTAARGASRVEAREGGATGELLFEGTLEEGQSQRFVGETLWLVLNRPDNLRLRLNGERVERFADSGPIVVLATADAIRQVEGP